MEQEKKIKDMLERIDLLNIDIERGNQARNEREVLRVRVADLMEDYTWAVKEMYDEEF